MKSVISILASVTIVLWGVDIRTAHGTQAELKRTLRMSMDAPSDHTVTYILQNSFLRHSVAVAEEEASVKSFIADPFAFFRVDLKGAANARRDPSIAYNVEFSNPTSEPGLAGLSLDFEIVPLAANTVFGELNIELVDANNDGTAFMMGRVGATDALQRVYVTNSSSGTVTDIGPLLGTSITAPGNYSFHLDPFPGLTPADAEELTLRAYFDLSPGDTARLTSRFVIDEGTGIPFAEIPVLPNSAEGPFFNVINVDSPETSLGDDEFVGLQTQLNVFNGGSLGNNFNAGDSFGTSFDTEVNIMGGTVGDDFHANVGSVVNVSGGTMGNYFRVGQLDVLGPRAEANISGGTIGGMLVENATLRMSDGMVLAEESVDYFGVGLDGVVEMSGGTVGVSDQSGFFVSGGGMLKVSGGTATRIDVGNSIGDEPAEVTISDGSVGLLRTDRRGVANIMGGSFDQVAIFAGGVANVSGGDVSELTGGFQAFAGSTVNLFGTEFSWDGEEIEGLELGVPYVVPDRDSTLSGTLADGTPFSFAPFPATQDFLAAGAQVTITLSLPGDFNNDGIVDAADYTVWRDALGTDTVLPHDTSPGMVSQLDYDVWKQNFGLVWGGSEPIGVPEPGSAGLLVLGLMALGRARRSSL